MPENPDKLQMAVGSRKINFRPSGVFRSTLHGRRAEGVVTTNLDVVTLPKRLEWTRREPEMHVDPRMAKRYGIGRVFELQPGERIRLLLPIVVPQAHPNDFVEHFVFGYSSPSSGAAQGAYETYVAELRR